jgi:hypothetical protein
MIFTPTAFFNTPTLVASIVDPFPSGLNSGLLGRFEVTNNLSWPGSGSIMYNLSTASLYATSSTATIWSASAVDTTNGVQLNGTSTRVDFGIISTYNSGSFVMNSAMTASNEFTVVYLATLDSTGGTTQVGLSAWNDYFADTGASKYISLVERTSTGGTNTTNLRSNNSYNGHSFSSYYTNDVLKMYGTRVAFTTNGESYWRGTSNFVNFTPSGTTFNTSEARIAPWTFGTRGSTTLGGFYSRYWKGKLYAAYFWNRRLSDAEMGDLQTYLNTYVKANS